MQFIIAILQFIIVFSDVYLKYNSIIILKKYSLKMCIDTLMWNSFHTVVLNYYNIHTCDMMIKRLNDNTIFFN